MLLFLAEFRSFSLVYIVFSTNSFVKRFISLLWFFVGGRRDIYLTYSSIFSSSSSFCCVSASILTPSSENFSIILFTFYFSFFKISVCDNCNSELSFFPFNILSEPPSEIAFSFDFSSLILCLNPKFYYCSTFLSSSLVEYPLKSSSYFWRTYWIFISSCSLIFLWKVLRYSSWTLRRRSSIPPSITVVLWIFSISWIIIWSFCLIFSLYFLIFVLYFSSYTFILFSFCLCKFKAELKFSMLICNFVFSSLSFCFTDPLFASRSIA